MSSVGTVVCKFTKWCLMHQSSQCEPCGFPRRRLFDRMELRAAKEAFATGFELQVRVPLVDLKIVVARAQTTLRGRSLRAQKS